MQEAVIVAAVRTPIGKAPRGAFARTRADELAAAAIRAALARVPALDPAELGDVILGCAQPEAEQGMNVARVAALRAGLPPEVPAMTVNRFCASGLQAVALAAQRVMLGEVEAAVAGGVETMSHVPMGGHKPSPNPWLMTHYPQLYLAMGHTVERVATRWGVRREEQDAWALESHRRAAAAIDAGRFSAEIVPVTAPALAEGDGRAAVVWREVREDEGVRRDTSLERLAALPPVFREGGTVTAGNSSQTSDGAAAVVVLSARRAEALGLRPLAAFRAFAVAGCEPEVMGIGPVHAVPRALRAAGLALADVELVELNEAFASQVVAVIRELGLDPARVNVNGGAIALGHPLGCTGARQVVTLVHEAARRRARAGLVTMCVGGGMGAAAVFEFPG